MNQNNKNLKYILYVRKSSESEDRQMESIDDQIKALRAIAKRQGLNVVFEMQEAKSAKKPGRAEFAKMLEKINSGEADAILCWKLNRLSRNPIDGGSLSWMLQNSVIKAITTSERTHYPDENVILLAVEFGMANQFLKDLSKDTKRGLQSKAERGWYPCPAPLGYMPAPDKIKGEKEIVPNPKTWEAVRKIWDLVLTGEYNPAQALDKVNAEYGLTRPATKKKPEGKYSKSTIYYMMRNPFYYGDFEYPKGSGNWIHGKHKPMITKQEFDKVQTLISKTFLPNNDTELKDLFPYKGPLLCGECGCSVTAERKKRITCDCKHRFSGLNKDTCPACKTHVHKMKNPKIEEHYYYHCTKKKGKGDVCSQKSYTPAEVEGMIETRLSEFSLPKEFIEIGMKVLENLNKKEESLKATSKDSLEKQISGYDNQLNRLLELRMSDDVDQETYQSKKKDIENQRREAESTLKIVLNNDAENKAKYYFDFALDAVNEFNNASPARKKSIFYSLGSNQLLIDEKLDIPTDSVMNDLLSVCRVYRAENGKVRTSLYVDNKGKSTSCEVPSPVLLHRQGSNL